MWVYLIVIAASTCTKSVNPIKANMDAINEFLSYRGETNSKKMSAFLFEVLSDYLNNHGKCWTKKGGQEVACRFGPLYRLVNNIQMVE